MHRNALPRLLLPLRAHPQLQHLSRPFAPLMAEPTFSTTAPSTHSSDAMPTTTSSSETNTNPNANAPLETPVESSIRQKLTAALAPESLHIVNDSHKHAHHAAMASWPSGAPSAARETHFRVAIISDAFEGKRQPARHRMVYALLKEEMERQGGVHALQILARTPAEEAGRGKD